MSDVLGLRRDLPDFSVRMSLATGDLEVGTIGSAEARSFTVIGDTDTLLRVSRVRTRSTGRSILVDEQTFQLAQHDIEGSEVNFLTVIGRTEPVRVYEILGPAGRLSDAEQKLCGYFAKGLAAYRTRN